MSNQHSKIMAYMILTFVVYAISILIVNSEIYAIIILCSSVLWLLICHFFTRASIAIVALVSSAISILLVYENLYILSMSILYTMMLAFIVINIRKIAFSRRYNFLAFSVILLGVWMFIHESTFMLLEGAPFGKVLSSRATNLIPYLWLLVAAPVISRHSMARQVLVSLAIGGFLVIVNHIVSLQYWSISDEASIWQANKKLLGGYKNIASLVGVTSLVVLLAIRNNDFKSHFNYWILPIFISLLGVLLFFSRSSYLAALVCLIYLFRRRIGKYHIALILLIIISGYFAPQPVVDRIYLTWEPYSGFDLSSETRIQLWSMGIQAFLDYPLLGIGTDNLQYYIMRNSGYFGYSDIYLYAHNYFISMFALTGIVGGLIGLNLYYQGFRFSKQASKNGYKHGEAVFLILMAYAVSSLFGDPLFERSAQIVLIVALSTIAYDQSDAVVGSV